MKPRDEALIRLGIGIAERFRANSNCKIWICPTNWGTTIRIPYGDYVHLDLFAAKMGETITKFWVGYEPIDKVVLIREYDEDNDPDPD